MSGLRLPWSDLRADLEEWAFAPGAILPGSPGWWRGLWITAPAILALIVCAAWIPGFREHFRMRPAVPLAALAVTCAWGFGANALDARRPFPPLAYLASVTLHGALFQILVLSLVLCSSGPGRALLVPLSFMAAAFQSLRLRPTPRFPWPLLGHAFGMGAALAVARPPDVGLLALVCGLGLGAALLCGTYAEGLRRSRRSLASHAEAIEARAREGELSGLSASLLERMQRSHNARSALTSALLDADRLARLAPAFGATYAARVEGLRGTLETLRALLDTRRRPPQRAGSSGSSEPVAVLPVVQFVIAAAQLRTSAVRLAVRAGPGAKRARARVAGGAEGLGQMLEAVVENARQGDGVRTPSRVDVEVSVEERTGALAIAVRDDGPGFPPDLLEGPLAPFVSRKPGGLGLGLYTAERLARASGGSLQRENLPGGGARVTLFLQLAPPDEEPPRGAPARQP